MVTQLSKLERANSKLSMSYSYGGYSYEHWELRHTADYYKLEDSGDLVSSIDTLSKYLDMRKDQDLMCTFPKVFNNEFSILDLKTHNAQSVWYATTDESKYEEVIEMMVKETKKFKSLYDKKWSQDGKWKYIKGLEVLIITEIENREFDGVSVPISIVEGGYTGWEMVVKFVGLNK